MVKVSQHPRIPIGPAPFKLPSHAPQWFDRLLGPALLVIAGLVLGQQYVTPNKRVIAVMLGLVITGLAWRVGIVAGLGVLILALPFPRGTVFGNTNLALVLVLLVLWMLRITQRLSPPPRRSPVDLPIIGMIVMYVLSFYNVHDDISFVRGLTHTEMFVGVVLMFYLIVNNLKSGQDLERLHNFMMISAATVFALAIYELASPARVLVPGWIGYGDISAADFNLHGARVGSVFFDYELLSEYCALTLVLGVFLLVRARSLGRRLVVGGLVVVNTFVLFTTVTRGAMFALAAGILYMLWMVRRRLHFVPFTIGLVVSAVSVAWMNFAVANFTRSGDMFARLFQTKLVGGWMPDDRADAWQNAWGRAMVHPLLGGGPDYGVRPGWKLTWPHNGYLYYANIIGFTGLFFFLWMLVRYFTITRPQSDDFNHPDYAKASLLVCRAQLLIFALDEFKIEYLRSPIYIFVVWAMFAVWTATALIARRNAAAAVVEVRRPGPVPAAPRVRAVGQ
jgi:hypothetical protein